MVWAEIILIVIGVIMIGVSFFITERLSDQDLEQISMLSKADLNRISELQLKELQNKLGNALEDMLDESLGMTRRGLERETNNKIMAVSEYSDTVLDNINKSHNEITFLYSMLNDKRAETAQLIGDLQRVTKQIREMDLDNKIARLEAAANDVISSEKKFETLTIPHVEEREEIFTINETTNLKEFQDVTEDSSLLSNNEKILLLYKEGKNEVEIAKQLDCGLGEVRLVLGLYK